MDTNSVDFHGKLVFSAGATMCQACHGDDFSGGESGIACGKCHAPGQSASCVRCHGGVDNQTGAPPRGLHGDTAKTSPAVGAHTPHLAGSSMAAAVPCASCHTLPPFVWDSAHLDYNIFTGKGTPDSIAEVSFHGYAVAPGASWNRADSSCQSTYCHGNFTGGKTGNAPVWTGVNQARCGSCHDTGGQPASLGWKHEFHVITVGLKCRDCHAGVVDSALHIINPALHVNGVIDTLRFDTTVCAQCHSGNQSCISCHGGTDNKTGAPPKGLRGETSTTTLAVGAHTTHVDGKTQVDGFSCTACHVTPTSIGAPGHLGPDSIAEVTWGDISNLNGNASWNRSQHTCASTYCHGKFVGGNATNVPNWTGTNQGACGTCHDIGANPVNLAWRHDLHVGSFGLKCADCHANVVDTLLTITDRVLHVNGRADTLTRDPAICAKCHAPGADLCIRCHGDIANQTGAPPKGLHGETSFTTLAVGAHTKHMSGGTTAGPRNCGDCHLAYTSVIDPGHWGTDSIAEITWGGFANKSGGATWTRNLRSCSGVYCHGNFAGGKSANAPVWTNLNEATCGSCHDVGGSPSLLLGRHQLHAGKGYTCYRCHASTVSTTNTIIGLNLHIDGTNTVKFWNDTGSYVPSTRTCSNPGGCHGTETWQ
jgi:predicted CxxxxCH...CXXCH cytochrome family protein